MALPSNHRHYQVSAPQIATITGAPIENVVLYWPLIMRALEAESICDKNTVIAAIATIACEVPQFKPVDEMGSEEIFTQKYDRKWSLGNIFAGDGVKYHGRGFIQLTGRDNYFIFGRQLNIDLLGHPELALEPMIAARILAAYFRSRGVSAAAQEENWRRVRFAVSGGFADWPRFMNIVLRLKQIM